MLFVGLAAQKRTAVIINLQTLQRATLAELKLCSYTLAKPTGRLLQGEVRGSMEERCAVSKHKTKEKWRESLAPSQLGCCS